MPLSVNLRHLEANNLELHGQLPVADLDLDSRDAVVQALQPLHYNLEVQQLDTALLVQGSLTLTLTCQCVRCLKSFLFPLNLPSWTLHLPFQGEDAAQIVNDCVDLTPSIREDILLAFPQHPLCEPECRGLPKKSTGKAKNVSGADLPQQGSAAWAELNKLKF